MRRQVLVNAATAAAHAGRPQLASAAGEPTVAGQPPGMAPGAAGAVLSGVGPAPHTGVDFAGPASQSSGRFVADMSHELRTPMNAILGMLQLLQRTPMSAQQVDYAGKAERAAHAMLDVLNDIVHLSELEAGQLQLTLEPFSFESLLRDLSALLAGNVGHRPIDCLFDIDPAVPPSLLGDGRLLRRILASLASEAIKRLHQGEVILRVRVASGSATHCRLHFSVAGTAVGAAAAQPHIVTAWSHAEESLARQSNVTGLGLQVCQRLVGALGGRIEFKSEAARGMSFSFELDFSLASNELARPASPVQGLRVLVVDANASARELLASMGASLGWTVDVADSVEAATALLARRRLAGHAHQVLFVDWRVTDLANLQSVRLLGHKGSGSSRVPLHLMGSAHCRSLLAQHPSASDELRDNFLPKPFTASMLSHAARTSRLDEHRANEIAGTEQASDRRRLTGVRLLVVEDNPINQEVAQGLLEAEGAVVSVVSNGALGVDAVLQAQPGFDLVLMDLHMPVMDGYTASMRLRRHFGPAELPIVALTANASPVDRSISAAAGMNDHLCKPFDLDMLIETLKRHLPSAPEMRHANTAGAAAQASAAAAPASAQLRQDAIGLAQGLGIDLAAALDRLNSSASVWESAARSLAADLPIRGDEFASMLANGNYAGAGRLMHALKGLGPTLGVSTLARTAATAEKALRACGQGNGTAEMDSLCTEVQTVIRDSASALVAIAERLGKPRMPAPAETPARDPLALRQGLVSLRVFLTDHDMAATDRLADLLQVHESAWQEELAPLSRAMLSLDFGTALAACERLILRIDP